MVESSRRPDLKEKYETIVKRYAEELDAICESLQDIESKVFDPSIYHQVQ